MQDLLKNVLEYFASKGWPVDADEEEALLRLQYRTRDGDWSLYVRADSERKQVMFYSVLPGKIPQERRPAVAEFLTRANFGLNIGNFEMDWEDGEVRFRTSVALGNQDLDLSLTDSLVSANLIIMEDHLAGIRNVASAQESPKEALAKIRQELDDIDVRTDS
jgi:hypothetical protein